MTEDNVSKNPEPIPYSDRQLVIGGTNYRSYAYPSDEAGRFNGRVMDDGNELRLEPVPLLSLRMALLCLGVIAYIGVGALVFLSGRGALASSTTSAMKILAFAAACVMLMLLPVVRSLRRSRIPWIVADRRASLIHLPRERRSIPIADVVRLQLVSLSPVGVAPSGLHFRGKDPTGELQIVFMDHGKEQTWCVVARPFPDAVRQFSIAFRNATGIAVSRVYRRYDRDWVVEPFDQCD